MSLSEVRTFRNQNSHFQEPIHSLWVRELEFALSGTFEKLFWIRTFRNQNSHLSEPKFAPFGTQRALFALSTKALRNP